MKLFKSFFTIILICILMACNQYPSDVEQALILAGKNKMELIKVLNHYKNKDKLKYEAACFLIGNMPYHQSEYEISLDSSYFIYFTKVDSIYNKIFGKMSISQIKGFNMQIINSKDYDSIRYFIGKVYEALPKPIKNEGKSDIETINSEFLIDNIENAFHAWHESPLTRKLSFNEFKEYVLPYRTTEEWVPYKKSFLKKIFHNHITKGGMNNVTKPIEWFKIYTEKCKWINSYIESKEHTGLFDLLLPRFEMDCSNLTSWTCNYFRSSGIPVVFEFTPQWQNKNSRHFWCASPDSNQILQPFTPPFTNIGEKFERYFKYVGKVYRKTYGAYKNCPYFLKEENEFIPEVFNTPTITDETFRYHQTVTLRMKFNSTTNNNLAYLCFFNSSGLNPVAWGRINKHKNEVEFEQVPVNTIFFPAYYVDEELKIFNDPFMLEKEGDLKYIQQPYSSNQNKTIVKLSIVDNKLLYTNIHQNTKPLNLSYKPILYSKKATIDMVLLRKYPPINELTILQNKLKGSFVVGSNQLNGPFDTLLVLPNAPGPYIQEYNLQKPKKYRYYFFWASDRKSVQIAHLEFLGNKSPNHICTQPTPLPIFSAFNKNLNKSTRLYKIDGEHIQYGKTSEFAFDNDMETTARSFFLGIDYKTPVKILSVRLAPVNGNNMIVVGDNYELSYFKNGDWIHFETKKAEYNYLEFKQVPYFTIYWLKNLDHGKDELPFWYVNNRQKFIYQ